MERDQARGKFASLEALREERRRYVEAARNNGFEDGLRSLLADLYPDNAHFIYELLQNAEDAGASTVDFELQSDRLVVTHDGNRPFTLEDITSITGIGQSGKKDDPTQIGKFGVGFKAVFAYTGHPEVHSGSTAFVIANLFVPEVVEPLDVGAKTCFIFPFDRIEKPPTAAYEEVARGLREISGSTLLFLKNIRSINYEIGSESVGFVEREDSEAPRITITHLVDDKATQTSWLRLRGEAGEMGSELTVAVAFELEYPEASTNDRGAKAQPQVRPVEHGDTCIYFPAAKETSGLRFHIHAPFASTVARDSVRDSPDNVALVAAIGDLIVESLPDLRDAGLIDGLLSTLPNAEDPLEAPYVTIRDKVYEAFQSQALTPVYGGGGVYAKAGDLLLSPPEFRAGLQPADLPTIVALWDEADQTATRWVQPRRRRADQFLRGLKTVSFGWAALAETLDNVEKDTLISSPAAGLDEDGKRPASAVFQEWLMSKSDKDLRSFYEMLGHGARNRQLRRPFNIPWIRRRDGDVVSHVVAKEIYLPDDRNEVHPDRVPAALAFFSDDETNNSNTDLASFYNWVGVRPWDEKAAVTHRLGAYVHSFPGWTDHLDDLRLFIKYLDSHPFETDLFRHVRVLQGADERGQVSWVRASDIVLDVPFRATGLAGLHTTKHRLHDGYRKQIAGVADFAEQLGAVATITIDEVSPFTNPEFVRAWRHSGSETVRGVRRDWDIPEFDSILELRQDDVLRLLWEVASEANSKQTMGRYRANARTSLYRFTSKVVQRMSTGAWVLDAAGQLRTPQSMTIVQLPEGWPPPGPESLAIAAGFGLEAREQDQKSEERREHASSLGIPLELAEGFADLDEEQQTDLVAYFHGLKDRSTFPSSGSANPDRRAELVRSDARDAPVHYTEIRERTVVSGAQSETRARAEAYLREQYTNEQDLLYCQACHDPAEFRLNEKWYFEKVQFVKRRQHLHFQNYLALCPRCAAKYQYVRQPNDDGLLARLLELEIPAEAGTVPLPILLNEKRVELRFTGKHAIDLKAVLQAAGEDRSDT